MRCFPAARPNDFISLRTWDKDGQEHELGILRHLDRWTPDEQKRVEAALSRRYCLRRVSAIHRVKLEYGYLFLDTTTDHGPTRITMRWSQSQAQDFGESGKVLLDADDNRFLVPDVEALPPATASFSSASSTGNSAGVPSSPAFPGVPTHPGGWGFRLRKPRHRR